MATENNAWAIFRDVQDKTARENICVEMKESFKPERKAVVVPIKIKL